MSPREVQRLLGAVRALEASERAGVIATIVRVEGSAYRREGTHMLVRSDGSYECLLSGGCIEAAVADLAIDVLATRQPRIASFDLSDRSLWSLGVGCGGCIHVLLECLGQDPLLRAWLDILEAGSAAAMVTFLEGAEGRLIVYGDGTVVRGTAVDPQLEEAAIAAAHRRLLAKRGRSAVEQARGVEFLCEVSCAPPQLFVFGAGPDAEPLVRQAWQVGFAVTVIDPRAALVTAERFPGATLVCAHPAAAGSDVTLDENSFVIVMNHQFDRDEQCLRLALASDAPYIGMLGPRSRFEEIRARLEAMPSPPSSARWARVRSPVGLALGAETPEEIALSIVAEIVAVHHGFAGGSLNGAAAHVHDPAASHVLARS
jgi:xanthine/CO dehydrogenase XdhC/CoxF family maturation factor